MKAKKIDHIGIVVKNLEDGLATFENNFGFRRNVGSVGEVPELGIKTAFIPVGESDLEFIESISDDGAVAKFAAERGEGTIMMSLEVEDIHAAVESLRAKGASVGDPRDGLAWVSMKSTHGVNLQLVQRD